MEIACRTGAGLLRAGFPIYDSLGAHTDAWIGYAGTRRLIFAAANLLAAHYQEIRPYVSRYRGEPERASSGRARQPWRRPHTLG